MRRVFAVLLLLPLAVEPATAAGGVAVRLSRALVYPGETVQVTVTIASSGDPVRGLDLEAPKGFSVEGPFGGVRKTTVIQGVKTSSFEVGFRITPPIRARGAFKIGPLHVTRKSGRTQVIPVGTLTIGDRPDRGIRMTVSAEPPSGPVGMPFLATYRILYSGKPFEDEDAFGGARNPYGLTALSLPVLQDPDVRVEPVEEQDGEVLGLGGGKKVWITRGGVSTPNGAFRAIDFRLKITPLVPKSVDLSASVGMALVVRTERRRDFFGGIVEVPVGRNFSARTAAGIYKVAELPEEGRPHGFTGAVGRFSITASTAVTEVNAYDPIDVKITVTGRGVLERLALPRYADFGEIAKRFEVDTDVDPGKVTGAAKVFRVTFRPRSSAVTALPALPFPYYDPWKRAYEVALSTPIPLTVHDVKTVRTEDSVGAPVPVAGAPGPAPQTPIAARVGIGANYRTLDQGTARLQARPPLFAGWFLGLLLGPPVLLGAAWIASALRSRPKDLPRGSPLSVAVTALRSAGTPDAAAAAVAAYLRRRLELPPGEITRKEIERTLAARVVAPGIATRLLAHWDALEQARFAGGTEVPDGIEETIRELERCFD